MIISDTQMRENQEKTAKERLLTYFVKDHMRQFLHCDESERIIFDADRKHPKVRLIPSAISFVIEGLRPEPTTLVEGDMEGVFNALGDISTITPVQDEKTLSYFQERDRHYRPLKPFLYRCDIFSQFLRLWGAHKEPIHLLVHRRSDYLPSIQLGEYQFTDRFYYPIRKITYIRSHPLVQDA